MPSRVLAALAAVEIRPVAALAAPLRVLVIEADLTAVCAAAVSVMNPPAVSSRPALVAARSQAGTPEATPSPRNAPEPPAAVALDALPVSVETAPPGRNARPPATARKSIRLGSNRPSLVHGSSWL